MQIGPRILDDLMEAAIDGGQWPDALQSLAGACHAQVGSMILVDRRNGAGEGYCLGVDEKWGSIFVESEARHVAIGAYAVKPGQVFTDRMVVGRRQFERSTFFDNWARPSGQTDYAGIAVLNEPGAFAFVGLSRGARKGAFKEEELEALTFVAPRVRQAAKIWVALGATKETQRSLEAAFNRLSHGVYLTDAAGRLRFANRAGVELLEEGAGLALKRGELTSCETAEAALLQASVRAASKRNESRGPFARLNLTRADGSGKATVLVSPLLSSAERPVAGAEVLIIALQPGGRSPARAMQLRLLYGLTPAESALADRLANGDGLKVAARALAIAPTTARTHLKRVFLKTGARNQIELASLIATSLMIKD